MIKFMMAFLIAVCLVNQSQVTADHRHIIIHVPYHVKRIKHIHTIIKHVPKFEGDKEEVLEHTYGQPMGFGSHEGHDEDHVEVHDGGQEEQGHDHWEGNSDGEDWMRQFNRISYGDEIGGSNFKVYQNS